MSCNGYIRKKASKVCVGGRNKRVGFYDRSIKATQDSFDMDLTVAFSAWCMVQTVRGVKKFDGTNTDREPDTTVFYTNAGYFSMFEKKQIATLNGRYFEIDSIELINEAENTVVVRCVELGNILDSDNVTELKTSRRR